MTAGSFTFFLCKQPLPRNITKLLGTYILYINAMLLLLIIIKLL